MTISRRTMLKQTGVLSAGFLGLHQLVGRLEASPVQRSAVAFGFGALRDDPLGTLDLPDGFSYHVFSKFGERMDDGLYVPALHDGMGAFPGPNGTTILVRNHEVGAAKPRYGAFGWTNELMDRIETDMMHDAGFGRTPSLGGTTTLVYDTTQRTLRSHCLSLAGTSTNCAGGATPWGTWITCEETESRADERREVDHGYCFEVPATDEIRLHRPVPIKAMGRFKHEAVAVDPRTNIIYLTEDQHEGLLYRFIPTTPGRLLDGGRLQVLMVIGQPSCDTRNWEESQPRVPVGRAIAVSWMDIDDIDAPNSDLRFRGFANGAARFARGEGIWFGNGTLYVACTNGGAAKRGQIFRYTPSPHEGTAEEGASPGELTLFVESQRDDLLRNADNLTLAPWGDLITCEDSAGRDRVIGITPTGQQYLIASNRLNNSEMAGCVFSPDGSTLFVNVQEPGYTVAITGPWSSVKTDA
ncbi:MAG: alkaline phosphatase PhoX [Planctomycetota bacterium]